MKLGIGSYTFGWAVGVAGSEPPQPMDEHGLLDAARGLGVHLVQIGDNLPLDQFDEARLCRLRDRAAQENVLLEVGARGLTPASLEAYITVARRLNASVLRFVIDRGDYQPSPERVVDILREAAPRLGDGLAVALENHDRFDSQALRTIIEDVGDEDVGICLDTANSYSVGEGWHQVAETLGPYAVNLHVKDFAVDRLPHQMGFTLAGKPAGDGLLDIPALLRLLAPHGRCHSAVLELWTPPEASLQQTLAKERSWADRSVRYLRQFLPR